MKSCRHTSAYENKGPVLQAWTVTVSNHKEQQ